jgi:GDPmannose 4,6-dehydratase
MSKAALVIGASGQDGAYLAKLLVEKGYSVFGAIRRSASPSLARLEYLKVARDIKIVDIELLEFTNLLRTLEKIKADEIYNLAAQSFVGVSFEQPIYTFHVNGIGVAHLLEAVRTTNPGARFYQASTSEMFGKVKEIPQNENTPFHPRSPYGVAKLAAHWMTVNYRESHAMFCASGILFNHESPLRGREFVTRKITLGLAEVKHGRRDHLVLGNLDAQRDWGFAGDYVRGMWQMLQQEAPEDYVLSTGTSTTVRAFVELAAAAHGFSLRWTGSGVEEAGVDQNSGRTIIRVDSQLYRPAEVDLLIGSPAKARAKLGWKHAIEVPELVAMMAEEDARRVRDGGHFF